MKASSPDYLLLIALAALVLFGLVILSTASVVISQDYFNESYYFLKHQLFYGLPLGIVAFFIFQLIDYHFWRRLALPIIIAGIVLLGLVFIPQLSYSHGGASRWLDLGFTSFQPFEFVKLALIIYLAALLSRKGKTREVIKQSIIPFLIIVGLISLILLLQPNMSALIFVFMISGLMYFMAGINLAYLFGAGVLAILSFFVLIKTNAYRASRLNVFLHPETDPQGIGYQINQALLAIGTGGLFGLGLGHSVQKWKYLPEVIGDSIFAVVAEEMGLLGAFGLIFLFVFIAWRGLRICRRAPDSFGSMLAIGLTGWIFFQAAINMAAITGLIPLTGMPLPFVSYGGTALAISLAGMGILTNISKQTK